MHCHHCGEKGHIRPHCPKYKAELERRGGRVKEQDRLAGRSEGYRQRRSVRSNSRPSKVDRGNLKKVWMGKAEESFADAYAATFGEGSDDDASHAEDERSVGSGDDESFMANQVRFDLAMQPLKE